MDCLINETFCDGYEKYCHETSNTQFNELYDTRHANPSNELMSGYLNGNITLNILEK